jgi:thiol-disulfide isomerase/thioredoxin
MKKIILLSAILLFPVLLNAGDQKEQTFNLELYRGKVVLLDFWASWCGPCRTTFPWLNEMQKRYQSLGLEVIGVNVDEDLSQAELFLSKVPADFTIVYDRNGALAAVYDLQGMPASYLIDREGHILKSHVGFFESETEKRESEIKQALKQ